MIRSFQSPCKICHRPATATFEDGDPQDAVDKFTPLLTHDRCYDREMKRRNSEQAIIDVCFEYARTDATKRGKIIATIRQTLLAVTRKYAEALTEILGSTVLLWSEDFADRLIEQPERVFKILEKYRDEVRRLAKKNPTQ